MCAVPRSSSTVSVFLAYFPKGLLLTAFHAEIHKYHREGLSTQGGQSVAQSEIRARVTIACVG